MNTHRPIQAPPPGRADGYIQRPGGPDNSLVLDSMVGSGFGEERSDLLDEDAPSPEGPATTPVANPDDEAEPGDGWFRPEPVGTAPVAPWTPIGTGDLGDKASIRGEESGFTTTPGAPVPKVTATGTVGAGKASVEIVGQHADESGAQVGASVVATTVDGRSAAAFTLDGGHTPDGMAKQTLIGGPEARIGADSVGASATGRATQAYRDGYTASLGGNFGGDLVTRVEPVPGHPELADLVVVVLLSAGAKGGLAGKSPAPTLGVDGMVAELTADHAVGFDVELKGVGRFEIRKRMDAADAAGADTLLGSDPTRLAEVLSEGSPGPALWSDDAARDLGDGDSVSGELAATAKGTASLQAGVWDLGSIGGKADVHGQVKFGITIAGATADGRAVTVVTLHAIDSHGSAAEGGVAAGGGRVAQGVTGDRATDHALKVTISDDDPAYDAKLDALRSAALGGDLDAVAAVVGGARSDTVTDTNSRTTTASVFGAQASAGVKRETATTTGAQPSTTTTRTEGGALGAFGATLSDVGEIQNTATATGEGVSVSQVAAPLVDVQDVGRDLVGLERPRITGFTLDSKDLEELARRARDTEAWAQCGWDADDSAWTALRMSLVNSREHDNYNQAVATFLLSAGPRGQAALERATRRWDHYAGNDARPLGTNYEWPPSISDKKAHFDSIIAQTRTLSGYTEASGAEFAQLDASLVILERDIEGAPDFNSPDARESLLGEVFDAQTHLAALRETASAKLAGDEPPPPAETTDSADTAIRDLERRLEMYKRDEGQLFDNLEHMADVDKNRVLALQHLEDLYGVWIPKILELRTRFEQKGVQGSSWSVSVGPGDPRSSVLEPDATRYEELSWSPWAGNMANPRTMGLVREY